MRRLLVLTALLVGCPSEEPQPEPADDLTAVVDAISAVTMKDDIDFLADDARAGRIAGTPSMDEARDYLVGRMGEIGLQPLGTEGFVYPYDTTPRPGRYQLNANGTVTENDGLIGHDIVGLLPGSDPILAAEYVVVSAHYDGLGVESDGTVNNGAYDDATGTAALLEIARVLVEHDVAPARSTVFVLTDGEENLHAGMAAWLEAPTVPAEDIVVGLSMDPLGRPMLPDVWTTVILGTERSPELDALWRASADVHEMELVFIHRDVIPLFSSDHDEFYASFSPERASAWVVNPGMAWYHTVDDDAETIDYRILRKSARYMTHMVHRLGNFEGAFTYRDAPEPGTQLGEDVVGLMDLVLSSDVLTGAERSAAITHRDTFQAIADAGTVDVLDNPDAQIFDAITFLLFDLNQAHPGPVPPPFPEE